MLRMSLVSSPLATVSTAVLASTADIGPFTNINVESTGLLVAILGGAIVASLLAIVIVRF